MSDLFAILGIALLVVVGYVLLLVFVTQIGEKGRRIVRTILVVLTILLVIWGILILGMDLNVLWLFLIGLIFISIIVPCWIITRLASAFSSRHFRG